ncbi:protein ALP [Salix suchowensis]|nr:protein ALP [Salix suchowensis]
MFRMDANTLTSLCLDLETQYGLKPSSRMPVIEKLAMFLFTIAVGTSNWQVQERFQHSGETVSRCINEVLKAVCLLTMDVIKPTDPDFMSIPSEIATNQRHMPHFKVSFNMQFTFVWAGWEGSAHDARIFMEAINNNNIKFPKPPEVKIVVASMALHNYIRRRSQDDITFAEYDRNPNFVPEDILPDVVPRSNSQRSQTRSRMDLVRDGIASSLMIE